VWSSCAAGAVDRSAIVYAIAAAGTPSIISVERSTASRCWPSEGSTVSRGSGKGGAQLFVAQQQLDTLGDARGSATDE
jgi:hypothetical protein